MKTIYFITLFGKTCISADWKDALLSQWIHNRNVKLTRKLCYRKDDRAMRAI